MRERDIYIYIRRSNFFKCKKRREYHVSNHLININWHIDYVMHLHYFTSLIYL